MKTAVDTLTSAVNHGVDSLALTFFGGEPLLESSTMFEILDKARELEQAIGVPTTAKVCTNGVLLDERIIQRAGRTGLFISLSFDGVREANDLGRKTLSGGSSFGEAERALRLLVSANRPFAVYSVITTENVAYLATSVKYLWGAGARIILSSVDYASRWGKVSLHLLRQQYKLTGKFYRRLLKRKEFFHLEPFDSRIPQTTRASQWKRCNPGLNQIVVAPDGTLFGCIEYYHRGLLPLGTASTWLDSASVKHLAKDRSGCPTECVKCGIRDRCNNSCSCVNLRGTGQANRPPTSLCLCERETTLAADCVAQGLFKRRIPEFLLRSYSCRYHLLTSIEKLLETMEVNHESA